MKNKIKGAAKTELPELPQIKERISFLYLERCLINRQDSAISITDDRGTVNVPALLLVRSCWDQGLILHIGRWSLLVM